MEMEKKNIAIIVLAIALVASGVGNIVFAVAGESIYGGDRKTLRIAMVGDIDTIDPVDSWDAPSNDVMNQITEPLVWYDVTSQETPDEAIQLVPCLATDWSYNEAGTELTMNLRKGVLFQDGEDFNADAVVYSIERLMYFTNSSGDLAEGTSKAFPWSLYYFADGETPIIKDIEKTGEYQVKFTLNAPFGPFVPLLGYTASNIVSPNTPNRRYLDLTEDILVGTGPFNLEYYRSETECKFSRFRNWWGGNLESGDPVGSVYWDEMVYVIYEDATTASNAQLGGDVDYGGVIASLLPQAREDPDIEVKSFGTGMCYYYWGVNCKLFTQQERAAMAYAINYTYVTEEIRQGLAVKANTCVPTALPGYDKEVQPPAFDIEAAREIMNSEFGTSLDVTDDQAWLDKAANDPFKTIKLFRHEGSHFNELLNAMITDNFANIGLDTEEDIRDWTTFLQWSAPGGRDNLEFWYIGWCPDYLSAFNMMNPLFSPASDAATHRAWAASDIGADYNNTVKKWLVEMETETDPEVRQELAEKIQRELFDGEDAFLPHIPMFYSKITYVHSAALRDVTYTTMHAWYWARTYRVE
jgi:peptide/nickel transport system substrate-binding protein